MTAVVKCNITSLALKKLRSLQWGIGCANGVHDAIAENYIEFLSCDDIDFAPCKPYDCDNPPIVFTCALTLTGVGYSLGSDNVTVTFFPVGLAGGVSPLSYQWSFNQTHFTASGPLNSDRLVLTIKPGLNLDVLVSPVGLGIIDNEGCNAQVQCFFVRRSMHCEDYVPCNNPDELRVLSMSMNCAKADDLVVKPKK